MKKRILALVVTVIMMMGLVGCGSQKTEEAQEPEKEEAAGEESTGGESEEELVDVTFRLNYTASGLHAPYYYALEKGLYKEAGLNVTIGEGTGAGVTAKLVGTGDADIGLADSASVASAIAEGIPIKIVCPIYAVNAFAAISAADSGIETPKDLEGKKVGITTGDGPSNLMAAIVAANELDESQIQYVAMDSSAKKTALMNGDVDCILAGADNEAVSIMNQGFDVNVMRWSDYGASTVGLSLIASEEMIAEHPDVIEKFISATLKGWDECRENSDEAVDIFMKYYPTSEKEINAGGLEVALDCLFAEDSKTLGDLSAEDWEACRDLLVNYLGVNESIQATDLYTVECLPDELPAR